MPGGRCGREPVRNTRLRLDDEPRASSGDFPDAQRAFTNDAIGRATLRAALQHYAGAQWDDSQRYVLECHRYIELNPVRAGIVDDPGDYPWSSFHHHALGADDPLLSDHEEYLRFGDNTDSRLDAYARFVRAAIPADLLDEIRCALNKSRALGGEAFVAAIERRLGRCARPRKPGRPARGCRKVV